MKISSRARYAVMAMTDLAQFGAQYGKEQAVPLHHIAARQEISRVFLEQIFADLRRAGLVKSQRGKKGGYVLAHPIDNISIGEIINAMDGPVETRRCKLEGRCLKKAARCQTHELWAGLSQTIIQFLGGVSLADVVNKNINFETGNIAGRG